jgi:hypothetical protein
LLGADDAALARNLEISEPALYRWMREHPEFRNSIKAGREEADARVANSLFHKAVGYKHKVLKVGFGKDGEPLEHEYEERIPPDTASAIFWLKNRRRTNWRDSPTIAVGVQATGENVTLNMTSGEIAQGYMSLIETDE